MNCTVERDPVLNVIRIAVWDGPLREQFVVDEYVLANQPWPVNMIHQIIDRLKHKVQKRVMATIKRTYKMVTPQGWGCQPNCTCPACAANMNATAIQQQVYWQAATSNLVSSAATNIINSTATVTATYTVPWTDSDWEKLESQPTLKTKQLQLNSKQQAVIPSKAQEFALPNGAVLKLDKDGNYTLDDAKARNHYAAHWNRHFNPYLNASDLLVQFMQFLKTCRVRPGEVAGLPIALFVNWLMQEAALQDREAVPPLVTVPRARLDLLERPWKPRWILRTRGRALARALQRPPCQAQRDWLTQETHRAPLRALVAAVA